MRQVVIQHLETTWTKRSRGGEGARLRHGTPEVLRLTHFASPANVIYEHTRFDEGQRFQPVLQHQFADEVAEIPLKHLTVFPLERALQGRFHRDSDNAAVPTPVPFHDLERLPLNCWGQIVTNARKTCWRTGAWGYQKHVWNIGWFERVQAEVFLTQYPYSTFREMAYLR